MNICDIEKCSGCFACMNVCTQQAIHMKENTKGFLYPELEDSKCVKCGRCVKTCPVNITPEFNVHRAVYAALDKNDGDRAKSTSGGIFAVLAKQVIKHDGFVYGAALGNDMVVRHIETHTYDGLDKLRNSKYVQSEIGFCYQKAERRLLEGKQVLFSGTPCQIAGLRNYLKKGYPNLLTVDILCHGVPSPGLFKKYVIGEEQLANAKMNNMLFRSKRIGWKKLYSVRTFDNGNNADWGDSFVPGFLLNLYLRDSCYSCPYACEKRQGDITLGDYWEYQETPPEYIEDDDKGISLVIINTEKGKRKWKQIRRKLITAKRTMEDAKLGNPILYKPALRADNYESFWKDAQIMDWNELKDKYIQEQNDNDWMSEWLREYYDIPVKKRYYKHMVKCNLSRIYHAVIKR